MFDLDGVLVDTRDAVRMAYREAGVTMPDDAWGKPWREWLDDPQVHANKNRHYADMLRQHATALPLLDYAEEHRIPIITGASREATRAINIVYGVHLNVIEWSCSLEKKVSLIKAMRDSDQTGIYVDDNVEACQTITEVVPDWRAITPYLFCKNALGNAVWAGIYERFASR